MNQADKANVFDRISELAERGYEVRIRRFIRAHMIKLCDDENCIERAVHLTAAKLSNVNLYLAELASMETELSSHRKEPFQ